MVSRSSWSSVVQAVTSYREHRQIGKEFSETNARLSAVSDTSLRSCVTRWRISRYAAPFQPRAD